MYGYVCIILYIYGNSKSSQSRPECPTPNPYIYWPTHWPIYWPANRSHCDCSSCCSCPSCCGDCYCYYSEYSGSALQTAVKIKVSANTPYHRTLFIHAQESVAELWLVLCIYYMHCACRVVNVLCSYACCLLANLPLPYPAVYKWEQTDTTNMAPTWLQRMWYISTSFALGTEEDNRLRF